MLLEALEIKDQLADSAGRKIADRDRLRERRDQIQTEISSLNRRGRFTGEVMPK